MIDNCWAILLEIAFLVIGYVFPDDFHIAVSVWSALVAEIHSLKCNIILNCHIAVLKVPFFWYIYLGVIHPNSMQEFMLNYPNMHATSWNHNPIEKYVNICVQPPKLSIWFFIPRWPTFAPHPLRSLLSRLVTFIRFPCFVSTNLVSRRSEVSE